MTIIRFNTIYNGNPCNCIECALNRNCQIMQRFKCVFKPMQTFKNPKMPYIYVINLSRDFFICRFSKKENDEQIKKRKSSFLKN